METVTLAGEGRDEVLLQRARKGICFMPCPGRRGFLGLRFVRALLDIHATRTTLGAHLDFQQVLVSVWEFDGGRRAAAREALVDELLQVLLDPLWKGGAA